MFALYSYSFLLENQRIGQETCCRLCLLSIRFFFANVLAASKQRKKHHSRAAGLSAMKLVLKARSYASWDINQPVALCCVFEPLGMVIVHRITLHPLQMGKNTKPCHQAAYSLRNHITRLFWLSHLQVRWCRMFICVCANRFPYKAWANHKLQ